MVKVADIGDALLCTPALAALRAAYPDAVMDALVTSGAREVLAASGLLDGFHVLDPRSADRRRTLPSATTLRTALGLRRDAYDTAVLLHHLTTRKGSLKHAALLLACGAPRRVGLVRPGSSRGWFLTHRAPDLGFDGAHEVEAQLSVAAAAGAGAPPATVFRPGPEAVRAAEALLSELGPSIPAPSGSAPGLPLDASGSPATPLRRRLVAIHPGTGPFSPARRWSPAGFAAVAEHAHRRGWGVVLVGQDNDATHEVRDLLQQPLLDLTGRTDLATLGAVMGSVDALVANDGGVMHLAAAMRTPVVAVFGPSNPVAWGPWPAGPGSPHRVVALRLPCRPCFYVDHRLGAPDGCATRDCLRWLAPRWVIQALDEVMDSTGTPGRIQLSAATPRPDQAAP